MTPTPNEPPAAKPTPWRLPVIRYRKVILIVTALLAIASGYYCTQLKFSFDFEQFFPKGDPDLAFFQEFREEFESDDNFLLVALVRREGVFDSTFLNRVHNFSLDARGLPYVTQSQSLTQISYPVKTPFGITTVPAIARNEPARYADNRERIMEDERFVNSLINKEATALVTFLKTKDMLTLDESRELMAAVDSSLAGHDFAEVHMLGRAYFQVELVDMQIREVVVSAIVAAILVAIILFIVFRRPAGILVALTSIGLGLLFFMGFMGATGRELTAIAALYPVLMIIVGTSDVVHIMTKYIDELKSGKNRSDAIQVTIREIGLATLLTSITTAIGFATLLTSRITPIRDFGINAAVGVVIAYVTVIFFTTSCLTYFSREQVERIGRGQVFWDRLLARGYQSSKRHRLITVGIVTFLIFAAFGISRITTNYSIIKNLPRDRQVTTDFQYFERELTGFRPFELAVITKDDRPVQDFAVMQQIAAVEDYIKAKPFVQAVASITAVYRGLNQMESGNRSEAYVLPDSERDYERYRKLAQRAPQNAINVLVSKDGEKARITSRLRDIGADSIKTFGNNLDRWIDQNIDTSLVTVRQTGTGLIVDKNSEYVRRSLLMGLGIAILIVSALMALLFRNFRMLFIALVPNVFPLLLAGAILGYLGIELEAGVSIVFAVIFGIAVDDTIHFLSKYKLVRDKGYDREQAIEITFRETGKAIILTSIVLFFGFLVMLFSIHPPSVTIGLLISLTLASAVISDLYVIPILIRKIL